MTTQMTPERFAQIEARRNAASRGPWHTADLRHQRGGQIRLFAPGSSYIANILAARPNAVADADFIEHAWQDVDDLLAEVERLRAELAIAQQRADAAEVKTEAYAYGLHELWAAIGATHAAIELAEAGLPFLENLKVAINGSQERARKRLDANHQREAAALRRRAEDAERRAQDAEAKAAQLVRELDDYKAPPDIHDAHHMQRVRDLWVELIRERASDPEAAADAVVYYARIAIESAERETGRAMQQALAWAGMAVRHSEEVNALHRRTRRALDLISGHDGPEWEEIRAALTEEVPSDRPLGERLAVDVPDKDFATITERTSYGVRWSGWTDGTRTAKKIRISHVFRPGLVDGEVAHIRGWQQGEGLEPDAEPVERTEVTMATRWEPIAKGEASQG